MNLFDMAPLKSPKHRVGRCWRCKREAMPLVCVIGEWRCVSCWGGGEGLVRADDDPTLYDEAMDFGEHQGNERWVQWCADNWQDILVALKKYDGSNR